MQKVLSLGQKQIEAARRTFQGFFLQNTDDIFQNQSVKTWTKVAKTLDTVVATSKDCGPRM